MSFHSHQCIRFGFTVRKRSNRVEFDDFLPPVTSKFYGWQRKIIGHLFYTHSNFSHHFIAIGRFRFEVQSGNAQIGSNLTVFTSCYLEILRMTLKNNIEPLLYAHSSFMHHFVPIDEFQFELQSGKWTNRFLTSVTLTFDLWPWIFAWTPLLSMVITPADNFMIIWWQQHSEKSVTDGRTDRRTGPFIVLLGRS